MNGERLIKTVMFGAMEGRNSLHGEEDPGTNGWMMVHYRDLYRAAQNRELWSEIVRTAVDIKLSTGIEPMDYR